MYDGIHYDAVFATIPGNPRRETTVFDCDDDEAVNEITLLAQHAHAQKLFTDTSNFSLVCNICQGRFSGEQGALRHAADVGHNDFKEISQ